MDEEPAHQGLEAPVEGAGGPYVYLLFFCDWLESQGVPRREELLHMIIV